MDNIYLIHRAEGLIPIIPVIVVHNITTHTFIQRKNSES